MKKEKALIKLPEKYIEFLNGYSMQTYDCNGDIEHFIPTVFKRNEDYPENVFEMVELKDANEPIIEHVAIMLGNTPIHFARWILKHAESYTTKDGLFCWKLGLREMDTSELYDEFLKELKGEIK